MPADFADDVLRRAAEVDDREECSMLAVALIGGQPTSRLRRLFFRAMEVLYEGAAGERERKAARSIVEMLALGMLTRVDLLDDEYERLHDEFMERESAEADEQAEFDQVPYEREAGVSWPLERDDDESDDPRDLVLDLLAEPGRVYLTVGAVGAEAEAPTGWVPVDLVPSLLRSLEAVAADAAAMLEEEEAEGDER